MYTTGSPPEAALNDADAAATDARSPFQKTARKRSDTVKGALYHEYDLRTHQFIAHIRRIHPLNKDIEMVLDKGITVVKAANQLAALGEPLYYIHSKTKMYNELFCMIWDNVMSKSPTFALICPWFKVEGKKALDRLFEYEFVG